MKTSDPSITSVEYQPILRPFNRFKFTFCEKYERNSVDTMVMCPNIESIYVVIHVFIEFWACHIFILHYKTFHAQLYNFIKKSTLFPTFIFGHWSSTITEENPLINVKFALDLNLMLVPLYILEPRNIFRKRLQLSLVPFCKNCISLKYFKKLKILITLYD